jgi:apolipoprotein N-acyltransferase
MTGQLEGFDLLVLPEYSNFFTDSLGKDKLGKYRDRFLTQFANSSDTIIITSTESNRDEVDLTPENSVTHFKADGTIVSSQAKNFLIPGGEYLPWIFRIPLLSIDPTVVATHDASRSVRRGTSIETPITLPNGITVGSLACSGVISPSLYRRLANQGVNILTNSASLSIFGDAKTYHEQTKGFSRFHAIANRKPFAQSTKQGQSYIISSSGQFLEQSNDSDVSIIQDTVTTTTGKTIYTQFGELVLYLSVGSLAFIFIDRTLLLKLFRRVFR